ncbi:hypothetical protein MKX68_04290 [Paenibacillus sp. FSL M8-0212]|uniref:hypothetical protein n=1 Tax=Paenibacillus sp. FSL M8-0212 TaxID=2921618 RepID=UPI0030FC3067
MASVILKFSLYGRWFFPTLQVNIDRSFNIPDGVDPNNGEKMDVSHLSDDTGNSNSSVFDAIRTAI